MAKERKDHFAGVVVISKKPRREQSRRSAATPKRHPYLMGLEVPDFSHIADQTKRELEEATWHIEAFTTWRRSIGKNYPPNGPDERDDKEQYDHWSRQEFRALQELEERPIDHHMNL